MTARLLTPDAAPVGTRVLIDRDGGPVVCEVIERDGAHGLVRCKTVPGARRWDTLIFWRPWDAPVLAILAGEVAP